MWQKFLSSLIYVGSVINGWKNHQWLKNMDIDFNMEETIIPAKTATPFWEKSHPYPLRRLFKTEKPTSLLLIPTDKVLSLPWVPCLFMGKIRIKPLSTAHPWMSAGSIRASLSLLCPWFCWHTHCSHPIPPLHFSGPSEGSQKCRLSTKTN